LCGQWFLALCINDASGAGHDVAWIIAVPQQHATLEHFDQTSAALHPALCTY